MFRADFDRACQSLFTDRPGKGDLEAAQRSLDTVLKADPTFYPAYYVRGAQRGCTTLLWKPKSGQNVRSAHRPQACLACRLNDPNRFRLSANYQSKTLTP